MTEEMVYDPKTKTVIREHIFNYLYAPVNKRFDKRLKVIIKKNSELHLNNQVWMSYRGEYYTYDPDIRRIRPVNRLKPDLYPMMDEYLEELRRLNDTELPYVLGFITQALNSSNSFQDYFKLFPESMHKPIKQLVDRCACRTEKLNQQTVDEIKNRNSIPIELIKKRMVLNLLL